MAGSDAPLVIEAGYEDLENEELRVEHSDAGLLFQTLLRRLLDEQFDGSQQLFDDNAELKAAEIDEVDDARAYEVVLFDQLKSPAGVAWQLQRAKTICKGVGETKSVCAREPGKPRDA